MTVVKLPDERIVTRSPAGFRIIDEHTGGAPIGPLSAAVDLLDTDGNWQPNDTPIIMTQVGVLAFPGIDRRSGDATLPYRRYRLRLDPLFYRPVYTTAGGERFLSRPTLPPIGPKLLPVLPAPGYPFDHRVPVINGIVVNGQQRPVGGALVTLMEPIPIDPDDESRGFVTPKYRALSDDRPGRVGAFALPLRFSRNGPFDVIATRGALTGTISVQLPQATFTNQTITIN